MKRRAGADGEPPQLPRRAPSSFVPPSCSSLGPLLLPCRLPPAAAAAQRRAAAPPGAHLTGLPAVLGMGMLGLSSALMSTAVM